MILILILISTKKTTYSHVFAIEEYMRHVDLIDIQPVLELALILTVLVQIAFLIAYAMILQDLFHSFAFVVRDAHDLKARRVDHNFLVLFGLVVSLFKVKKNKKLFKFFYLNNQKFDRISHQV